MKIAVCVHLYHTDMWEEIENYLNNLTLPYKLYVNLPYETDGNRFLDFQWDTYVNHYQDLKKAGKDNHQKAYNHFIKHGLRENRFYRKDHLEVFHKISNFKNDSIVFLSPNKGMDIGGFLYTYKKIDEDTDLILKIHTKKGLGSVKKPSAFLSRVGYDRAAKTGKNWFNDMMNGVLKNEKQVISIVEKFKKNNKCGMAGYAKFENFNVNMGEMNKIYPILGISNHPTDTKFVGGTIFWVRNDIYKKYFKEDTINSLLNILPFGYVHEPSPNHAMERIFASIVYNEDQELLVID